MIGTIRVTLIGFVMVLASASLAITNEPTGLGAVKFGMTVEEAKKQQPKMEELGATENLGAAPIGGPYITRYVVRKQQIKGLEKPVDVELRFWKGRFWLYTVYFGENDTGKVMELLRKEYGPPTTEHEKFPRWAGEKSAVTTSLDQRWYTVNDEKLSAEAREWFKEVLTQRVRGGGGAGAAATPGAATPAASPGATAAATAPATGPTPAAGKSP